MPPRFKQVNDYSWGYYSPGICPTDYSEGCSFPTSIATTGPDSGWVSYGGVVLDSETVRICCPTGYTCVTEGVQKAYSQCVATTDTAESAFAIQVRWQESDLSILETDPTVAGKTYEASATSGATATVTATATGTGSTSESEAAESEDSNGGTSSDDDSGTLNKSTTISIAVVVAATVFATCILAFCLWARKRKRRAELGARLHTPVDKDGQENGGPMELDSKALASSAALSSELDSESVMVSEMPSQPKFYAELPGSMPQQYHEKDAECDTRSKPSEEVSQQEHGPFKLQPRRRSVARTPSTYQHIHSPSVASPSSSSWTSSVNGTVSDLTDQTNGRTL